MLNTLLIIGGIAILLGTIMAATSMSPGDNRARVLQMLTGAWFAVLGVLFLNTGMQIAGVILIVGGLALFAIPMSRSEG